MPKGARGEALLEVDGESYPILFTNRALAEAEQRTGKTITALARGAAQGALGVGDVAALLLTGMEAGRKDARISRKAYTMVDAYDLLDRLGFGKVAGAVFEAIGAVLAYDPDEERLEESEGADDDDRPPQ
jgi:hypothetical protein